ncbi:MAG: hypothetical protein IIC40_07580 [Candidatus Marinimicrobia bacterium]|nr:hypothetical protein [Candidatus Neomarinimicrobiota bacterium]
MSEVMVSPARESSLQFMSLRVDTGTSSSPLKSKRMEGDFALVSKGITSSRGGSRDSIESQACSPRIDACKDGNAAGYS